MTRDDFFLGLFMLLSNLWLIASMRHPDYIRGLMALIGLAWLGAAILVYVLQ